MLLFVQVRVGVCEWLAWLLRMRREPEVDLVTSSHRRASLIRRQSTRNDDIASRYSIRAGGHHLANEIGTNGNSNREEWIAGRRSTSLCRRGSSRSALRRNTSRVELENDSSQWRSIQTIPAGGELESDERSRSNTLLSNILDELRELTGKVERDEAKQDKINDWRFAAMVVDRLCLCAFTIFTVVSTFTILLSAPSFYAR